MDTASSQFYKAIHSVFNSMEQQEYMILGVIIVLMFFAIHLYSLAKEKNKLRETIDHNVKVFQKAFDLAEDAMLILSEKNRVIFANKSMLSLLELESGYQLEILRDMPKIKIQKEWISLDKFIEEQQRRIMHKVLNVPQIMLKMEGDDPIAINLHLDTVSMEDKDNELYSIITIQDLTQTQKFEKMKYRHKLTDMPNQTQALHDLPALYSKIHIENNKIALILISFDDFSKLRSIIGVEQSNEVLIKFSKYVRSIVNDDMNILVYHTFDNHFLLTTSNVESVETVKALVEDIQAKLKTFYKMEDVSLHLTVSAGIALYPDSGPTRKLLDNTYKALSEAQKKGNGKVIVYTPDKLPSKYDELTLLNDMKDALNKGEFEVYYQPIVTTENEEIIAAEALIKWIHPKYGIISPEVFIGLMEKTGFIIELGKFVLEEVLKQQKRWELFKFKNIEVSINVSMVEIDTGEFVAHVKQRLEHHQIKPESIKFEITEGIAMINESKTEKYFHALKKLGVGISLDDFGTGYTSFIYLKKIPADILKIDKSLVKHMLSNIEDQRIVHAMIELGHNLGMKIVVEGVETKKMVELLSTYGCDYMQGYYFSKPLPVFEFQKLLR